MMNPSPTTDDPTPPPQPSPAKLQPTQIHPLSPIELFVAWNQGESYSLSYLELRFHCPCASCVDENTGQRTVKKSALPADIRATRVELIGRYAIHITWSDRHQTGMYHFDRLFQLCQQLGRKLS